MLPICVRTERVWHKLPSIQGIRANLVYIVSLKTSWPQKISIYKILFDTIITLILMIKKKTPNFSQA